MSSFQKQCSGFFAVKLDLVSRCRVISGYGWDFRVWVSAFRGSLVQTATPCVHPSLGGGAAGGLDAPSSLPPTWIPYEHRTLGIGHCVSTGEAWGKETGKMVRVSPNWKSLFAPLLEKPARNLILRGKPPLGFCPAFALALERNLNEYSRTKGTSLLFKEAIRIEREWHEVGCVLKSGVGPCLGD